MENIRWKALAEAMYARGYEQGRADAAGEVGTAANLLKASPLAARLLTLAAAGSRRMADRTDGG